MYLLDMATVRCAECRCNPQECAAITVTSRNQKCVLCKRDDICCCYPIHNDASNSELIENPPFQPKETMLASIAANDDDDDHCCSSGICKNDNDNGVKPAIKTKPTESSLLQFFKHVKKLYIAAVGIEILCIMAAEIGENTSLYLFGFNLVGIPIAYAMGYALAGFTTFATILGRYDNYYGSSKKKIDSCCSVLEQGAGLGFLSNLRTTFRNFAVGIAMMPQLYRQPNLKYIMKTSLYILITAESVCILTAETVDLIFYQYSIMLSIPLALFAGAFAVVAPEAYRKIRHKTK
jgi:hypothetical protein